MPALFQAFRHGTLPEGGRIIGVGRDDLSDEQYRSLIQSRFDNVELAKRPSETSLHALPRCSILCAWTCPSPTTTPAWPRRCKRAMPTPW
jgi:glucose-6-phosphate 1-dehydrogenase